MRCIRTNRLHQPFYEPSIIRSQKEILLVGRRLDMNFLREIFLDDYDQLREKRMNGDLTLSVLLVFPGQRPAQVENELLQPPFGTKFGQSNVVYTARAA